MKSWKFEVRGPRKIKTPPENNSIQRRISNKEPLLLKEEV
jgi:hypothetical protein